MAFLLASAWYMETFLKADIAALFNVGRELWSGASRGSEGGNNWFTETELKWFAQAFSSPEDWVWAGSC